MRFPTFLFLLLTVFLNSVHAQSSACEIYNLTVQTGDCTGDSTYNVTINFQVANATNANFEAWANNGVYLGFFPLTSLPLTINNFPYNGGANDVIKVCINDDIDCCRTKEFPVPTCITNPPVCEIYDLTVQTGDCTGDSTYSVSINFQVANASDDQFDLWANGQSWGTFNLSSLPLMISNFPYNGGVNDFIKVCINDNAGCCKTKEFPVPTCLNNTNNCEIYDLTVQTGDCTGDSTYSVSINFQVANASDDQFDLWANGQFWGTFNLSSLPLMISNFPYNGGVNDFIKVCINDNAGCCKTKEFPVPTCLNNTNNCEIYDLTVQTGDCTGDSTYSVSINFQVANASDDQFDLWANGQFWGTFNLSSLPLMISNFPYNGGANDFIKVCINDNADCCRTKEFPVPTCLNTTNNCEIYNLTVQTGDCTGDSTYSVFINFQVANASDDQFDLWANGQSWGTFNLSSLPLMISNFPYNGGVNDFIKVCINDNAGCCKTKEFPVPTCLTGAVCHIVDAHAVTTPCICGQFFALVSFEFSNVGNGGFDIMGNGHNYGNFPYSTPQPIVLGPLPANGTHYEFVIKDHNHPDLCFDVIDQGVVECGPTLNVVQTPSVVPALEIKPNPAQDQVVVTINGKGQYFGQATAKVYQTNGQLVRSVMVSEATSFELDVREMPAGVYTIEVTNARGTWIGSLVKLP